MDWLQEHWWQPSGFIFVAIILYLQYQFERWKKRRAEKAHCPHDSAHEH